MNRLESKHQKIFIAALDWGWGHVTRTMALIDQLQKQGKDIVLGGSGQSGSFLKLTFPELKYYDLPAYAFSFDDTQNVYWQMMKKIPEVSTVMKKEQKALKEINTIENLDCIISDHRYGLYLEDTFNIMLCHQINLQAGNYSRIVNSLHHSLLNNFDAIWVPDDENRTLSGILSLPVRKLEDKIEFIGALSTMKANINNANRNKILILCTGPEPQRSNFEEKLQTIFSQNEKLPKGIIIQGTKKSTINWPNGWQVISFANRSEIEKQFSNAQFIISRSGYSTIMDLYPFQQKIGFIPTPGQTEQNYLAAHLKNNSSVEVFEQNELNAKDLFRFFESK